jgi:shikimate dehydrogenase
VGIDENNLKHLRAVIEANYPSDRLLTLRADATKLDALLSNLPKGSLVINATGMGKDKPGSPLSESAEFAKDCIIWELNYRGTLEFYHKALSQAKEKNLKVVDGWRYFIHGWSQVIAEVFDLNLTKSKIEELAQAAEIFR